MSCVREKRDAKLFIDVFKMVIFSDNSVPFHGVNVWMRSLWDWYQNWFCLKWSERCDRSNKTLQSLLSFQWGINPNRTSSMVAQMHNEVTIVIRQIEIATIWLLTTNTEWISKRKNDGGFSCGSSKSSTPMNVTTLINMIILGWPTNTMAKENSIRLEKILSYNQI